MLFTRALHEDAVNRLQLETDLRGAVGDGQLELHYQPVRSLPTSRVETLEALVRWRRSPDNLVGPDEFITVAEEVGLMGPIGRWVLREACRQRVDWASQGECSDDLANSVNLWPRQFNDATLVADVSGILAETSLPGNLLILEVTETANIGDIDAAARGPAGPRMRQYPGLPAVPSGSGLAGAGTAGCRTDADITSAPPFQALESSKLRYHPSELPVDIVAQQREDTGDSPSPNCHKGGL